MADKEQKIRRKDASQLLDKILVRLATWKDPEFKPDDKGQLAIDLLNGLVTDVERARLTLLTPCPGEAHRNPNIDNCMVCLPRWGYVGPKVKVT